MIGGVVVGGMFVAMCAWMAFGDDDPRWVRATLKNIVLIASAFGVLFVVIWAWYGLKS